MANAAQSGPCLRHLLDSIHALKRKRKIHLTAIAAVWCLLPAVVILFAAAGLDVLCHFGHPGRYVACVAVVAALLAALVFIIRTAMARLSDQAMATLLEKARPEADNAFINAVQFASSGDTPSQITETLLADAKVNPETIKPSELYSKKPLKLLAVALPIVAACILISFAAAPERMSVALRRILNPSSALLPFTRTHIVSLSPQDTSVQRGETVTITAELDGDMPDDIVVHWIPAPDSSPEIIHLKRLEDTDKCVFSATAPPVFDHAQFRLIAGDSTSEWRHVAIENPPAILRWEAVATPPSYIGTSSVKITSAQERQDMVGGSHLSLSVQVSRPLAKAELLQNNTALTAVDSTDAPSESFQFEADTFYEGPLSLKLSVKDGESADAPLPVNVIPDRPPAIQLVDTPSVLSIRGDEPFAIGFRATDDFGVVRVGLEHLLDNGSSEEVRVVSPDSPSKTFTARFTVETSSFNTNEELRFRLWAEDGTSNAQRRRAHSQVIQVKTVKATEENAVKKEKLHETAVGIAEILKRQKDALKDTNLLLEQTIVGQKLNEARLSDIHSRQRAIREDSIALLENRAALGGFADIIVGLANHEMAQAVTAFDEVREATHKQVAAALRKCTVLQTAIIAALSNMNLDALAREQSHQAKTDIFAAVQSLVKSSRPP